MLPKKKCWVQALVMLLLLCLPTAVLGAAYRTDFESYTPGDLNGQQGWTTNANGEQFYTKIVPDIVDPTNQCMTIRDNHDPGAPSATLPFGPLSGEQTDGIVTVQYRFNPYNNQAYASAIRLQAGSTVVVDFYNDYKATVQNTSSTQVWVMNHPLQGGSPGVDKKLHGVLYNTTKGIWYNMKFVLNFNTQTVDVYRSEWPKAFEQPVLTDIPFASSASFIDRLSLSSPSYGKNGEVYLDDLYITDGLIAEYDIEQDSAVYSVSNGMITASANLTMPVVGNAKATVFAVAYDANGNMIGINVSLEYSKGDLQQGVIPYQATFAASGTVAAVKLHVWESLQYRTPYCAPVICTQAN